MGMLLVSIYCLRGHSSDERSTHTAEGNAFLFSSFDDHLGTEWCQRWYVGGRWWIKMEQNLQNSTPTYEWHH